MIKLMRPLLAALLWPYLLAVLLLLLVGSQITLTPDLDSLLLRTAAIIMLLLAVIVVFRLSVKDQNDDIHQYLPQIDWIEAGLRTEGVRRSSAIAGVLFVLAAPAVGLLPSTWAMIVFAAACSLLGSIAAAVAWVRCDSYSAPTFKAFLAELGLFLIIWLVLQLVLGQGKSWPIFVVGGFWLTTLAVRWTAAVQRSYYLLQFLFFLRLPLLVAVGLLALPLLGTHTSIAGNWFDLSPGQMGFVAFLSHLLAWGLMYQIAFIWERAAQRNQIHIDVSRQASGASNPLLSWMIPSPKHNTFGQAAVKAPYARLIIFGLWFAWPLLLPALFYETNHWLVWPAAVAGTVAAWIVGGLARMISLWLDRRAQQAAEQSAATQQTEPEANTESRPPVELHWKIQLKATWRSLLTFFSLPGESGAHFVYRNIVIYLLTSIAVYLILGLLPIQDIPLTGGDMPVLLYILAVLLLISWSGSIITFFIDRWRLPVVLSVVLIVSFLPSDHTFQVKPLESTAASFSFQPTGQSLGDRIRQDLDSGKLSAEQPPIVLIAASGGGIAASYWTTLVLSQLHQHGLQAQQVQMISAVSGGAVGATYYRQAITHPQMEAALADAVRASASSSLAHIGFGVAYKDFWRRMLFGLLETGRGDQLELALRHAGQSVAQPSDSQDHQAPNPILALNATIAETGQRFVFSDYVHDSNRSRAYRGLYFHELNQGVQVDWITAARMSATFPFVSPVAKAALSTASTTPVRVSDWHLADGGYVDNWGVTSALDYIEALDQGLGCVSEQGTCQRQLTGILLIEVRAYSHDPAEPSEPSPVKPGLAAPLTTFLNVRNTTQVDRNSRELTQWQARFARYGMTLASIPIELPAQDTPLSWHLSEKDKQQIEPYISEVERALCSAPEQTLVQQVFGALDCP